MKISIILAHPDKNSFNAAIAKCCIEALAANGHTVLFHDLYAEKFDTLLPAKKIPRTAKLSDELKRHCDEISSADGINAYIETRQDDFPIKLKLAGITPERWTIPDSLSILYYMGWGSSANLQDEIITQM